MRTTIRTINLALGALFFLAIHQGKLSAAATLTFPIPPTNQRPQVNAGTDQTIVFPASAQLNGIVKDDGLPNPPAKLNIFWSKAKGPGTVTFADPSSPATHATFSRPGTYVLRLRAGDGWLSKGDRIAIVVK